MDVRNICKKGEVDWPIQNATLNFIDVVYYLSEVYGKDYFDPDKLWDSLDFGVLEVEYEDPDVCVLTGCFQDLASLL